MPHALLTLLLLRAAPVTSLEEVLTRARADAPEVQVASRLVAEAEANVTGQGVPLPTNPRLFADYRGLTVELPGQPVDPRHGYNLGVDGTFEVSGAGFLRVEEAQRRVKVARHELAVAQADAVTRAWLSWLEVQLSSRKLDTLEAERGLQTRVEAAAKERLTQGVASESELTTIRVEAAGLSVEVLETRRRLEAARFELSRVLDLPLTELQLARVEPALPEVAPEAELIEKALERRPELATLRARLAALDATFDRLGREVVPRLGYNVGLDAAPASPVFGFVGLSVEIPVAQRNQGPRAVANAQRETERVRLEAQLRAVSREVALARADYQSRREQLSLVEQVALPAARRTQALVDEGWRAGRFDVFRLMAATREVIRLEQLRVELAQAAWADFVALQRATGGLSS